MAKRLALVESPFKGRTLRTLEDIGHQKYDTTNDKLYNGEYIRALCRFAAFRGYSPLASHLFCTQFLDDDIPEERKIGIDIGFAWGLHADVTIVGVDRGLSVGVKGGIADARGAGRPIIWVSLTRFRKSWLPEGVERDEFQKLCLKGDTIIEESKEF